jgi:tetratricopeptide (TPR) repeat protein
MAANGGGPQRRWGDDAEAISSGPQSGPVRRHWWTALAAAVGVSALVALLASPRPDRPVVPLHSGNPAAQEPPAVPPESPPGGTERSEELAAEAQRLADQLLSDLPENPRALLIAGRIAYAFNNTAKADQCWEKCLRVNPGFLDGWCAVGEAAWEHGQFEKAADCLKKAKELRPRLDQKQVFFLADSLMNIGQAGEAAKALEAAARDAPLPPFGLFLLGHAYAELGEHEKAKGQFEAALQADPASINVHFNLAKVYDQLGQKEKAAAHRAEYARLKSQELKEINESRKSLRRIDWADVRPLARECFLGAGKVYSNSGRLPDAEKLWRRAAALDPESAEARQLLEMLYVEQGRREEAILVSRGKLPDRTVKEEK